MSPPVSRVSRIHVPFPQATPVSGVAGLVVAGVRPRDGFPGLVLVWDEDENNQGCSATNAIETVLLWLEREWHDFPMRDCVVIERDNEGAFDHAYPEWAESGGRKPVAPLVVWKPLRWPAAPSRTEQAFRGMFGSNAAEALRRVQETLAPR